MITWKTLGGFKEVSMEYGEGAMFELVVMSVQHNTISLIALKLNLE